MVPSLHIPDVLLSEPNSVYSMHPWCTSKAPHVSYLRTSEYTSVTPHGALSLAPSSVPPPHLSKLNLHTQKTPQLN
ncbi:hypothetical protein V6N12_065882 [Hibiscus sabdariffa]|uniref:Uncharacterized protein n=1 Tax=Hibiscus sabdariffa TaxID=183260 RepID=A0ABR2AH11_9ROSI